MADWTLERDQVRAIRDARAGLRAAAAAGDGARLDAAVASAVHAMWAADFSRTTICSLVGAAVDMGLPHRRDRVQRDADIRRWTERAGRLADGLAAGEWPRRAV